MPTWPGLGSDNDYFSKFWAKSTPNNAHFNQFWLHLGSDCAFLILEGESTETIYELNEKGQAFPVSKRVYRPGEVCAADEPDIHRVSNDGDGELINLHVYTPPLHAFNVYDPE